MRIIETLICVFAQPELTQLEDIKTLEKRRDELVDIHDKKIIYKLTNTYL